MAANFYLQWSVNNFSGTTGYKVLYKLYQDSLWNTFLTSGTTNGNTVSTLLSGLLEDRIYDWQIVNLSQTLGNPTSTIGQICEITDPSPALSVTNTTIAYSFSNLSVDITGYVATLTLYTDPSTIIATHQLSVQSTITDTFTGLQPLTSYYLNITSVANQFTRKFTYTFSTSAIATCSQPLSVSSSLTSGNTLTVHWNSPTPLPTNGFLISYRRNGDPAYLTYLTSGTTSGNTQAFNFSAPACYEGFIQSECSSSNLSIGSPFGSNSYERFTTVVTLGGINNRVPTISVTSPYGNPYAYLIHGSFIATANSPITTTFDVTYAAGATSQSNALPSLPSPFPLNPYTLTSGVTVISFAPLFNNGGLLQQFDNLLTPQYFKFTNALTSGITWNGDPMILPSFTLDQFSPTQIDGSSNVLAGQLQVSWIYHSIYNNGAAPNDTITLTVKDPSDSSVMGAATISPAAIGLRSATLNLVKQVTAITTTNTFNMIATWSDGTILDTIAFYLPLF